MRNRAKCTDCDFIIESVMPNDVVVCKCGGISIWGGPEIEKFECFSNRNFENFLRIDDSEREIPVKYKQIKKSEQETVETPKQDPEPFTYKDFLYKIDKAIEFIDKMIDHNNNPTLTNLDQKTLLLTMKEGFQLVFELFSFLSENQKSAD